MSTVGWLTVDVVSGADLASKGITTSPYVLVQLDYYKFATKPGNDKKYPKFDKSSFEFEILDKYLNYKLQIILRCKSKSNDAEIGRCEIIVQDLLREVGVKSGKFDRIVLVDKENGKNAGELRLHYSYMSDADRERLLANYNSNESLNQYQPIRPAQSMQNMQQPTQQFIRPAQSMQNMSPIPGSLPYNNSAHSSFDRPTNSERPLAIRPYPQPANYMNQSNHANHSNQNFYVAQDHQRPIEPPQAMSRPSYPPQSQGQPPAAGRPPNSEVYPPPNYKPPSQRPQQGYPPAASQAPYPSNYPPQSSVYPPNVSPPSPNNSNNYPPALSNHNYPQSQSSQASYPPSTSNYPPQTSNYPPQHASQYSNYSQNQSDSHYRPPASNSHYSTAQYPSSNRPPSPTSTNQQSQHHFQQGYSQNQMDSHYRPPPSSHYSTAQYPPINRPPSPTSTNHQNPHYSLNRPGNYPQSNSPSIQPTYPPQQHQNGSNHSNSPPMQAQYQQYPHPSSNHSNSPPLSNYINQQYPSQQYSQQYPPQNDYSQYPPDQSYRPQYEQAYPVGNYPSTGLPPRPNLPPRKTSTESAFLLNGQVPRGGH